MPSHRDVQASGPSLASHVLSRSSSEGQPASRSSPARHDGTDVLAVLARLRQSKQRPQGERSHRPHSAAGDQLNQASPRLEP